MALNKKGNGTKTVTTPAGYKIEVWINTDYESQGGKRYSFGGLSCSSIEDLMQNYDNDKFGVRTNDKTNTK